MTPIAQLSQKVNMIRLPLCSLFAIVLFWATTTVWSGELSAQNQNIVEETKTSVADPNLSTPKPPEQDGQTRSADRLIKDSNVSASTYNLEIEKRFNSLRSELLDQRANSIDTWLATLALILTFFGIVVAIAGFFGFSRFRQIEGEARRNAKAAEDFAAQARKSTEEIIKNREKSEDIIKTLTANAAAENPENVND